MIRSGTADLPLHYGRVPEAVIAEYDKHFTSFTDTLLLIDSKSISGLTLPVSYP